MTYSSDNVEDLEVIEQNHNESNTEVLKTKRLRLENVTSKITSTAAVDPRHLNVEVAD